MGCCFSSNAVEPENNQRANGVEITPPNKRSCTNVISLMLMIAFTVALAGLLGYCIRYGDIYRILNGYDDCANVCGRTNHKSPDPGNSCERRDMTNKKFLVINAAGGLVVDANKIHRECVESCDATEFREFFNRCIPKTSEKVVNSFFSKTGLSNFFQEVNEDLDLCWREIVYLCIIAFVFSIIMLVLFRYVVGFIVWLVLIGVSLTTIVGTIFLWITWAQEKKRMNQIEELRQDDVGKRKVDSYLAYAIVATLVTVVALLVIFVMRKRISLVISLFKEAGKAIGSMPMLLLEPVLTFVALSVTVGLWIYFSLWVESSGFLKLETNQSFHYRKDVTMKVTRWYNLFALFWFTQFIIGCQHMIIAGAVASWYFTRNKKNLSFPIVKSFKNLICFHLGSVALGSLLIAIVQMMRFILKVIQNHLKGSNNKVAQCIASCCQCCLCIFEKFLKYLSRNSYIETAIYGCGFCQGGRKAFKILTSNALRVAAINSVGDFVLFLGKAFVVSATVLVGIEMIQKKEGVQHVWVTLSIVGMFAYLTSHCFMTVYEMTIDTIFICFCEDCEQNDGVNKQYYMTTGLLKFLKSSKKTMAILDESGTQAWPSPKTISQTVDK